MAEYHHVKVILNQCLSFISYFNLHTLCHEKTNIAIRNTKALKNYQA